MRPEERQWLLEIAAALRGEVEARIEGERDRLLEITQRTIETLVALAVEPAEHVGGRRRPR